jgi:hypothetical protein
VTGNGQPDFACNAETPVTQGASTKIGGGRTNCTDGAPKSTSVLLTSAHMTGDSGSSVLRAFTLTDSADSACFVTFNEPNSAGAGDLVSCGARTPSLYRGTPGGMVTLFFPGPVTNNVPLSLIAHQNGAKQFGPQVACTPADGCQAFILGLMSVGARQRAVALGALPRFCAVAGLIWPREVESCDRICSDT